ncbi:MAG TPA: ComEC/Rec2 family competence protein [Allosphingosinicella sp.]|nr:ComEC/Rec2 family competence protein [Allosphingosinicella sp.]
MGANDASAPSIGDEARQTRRAGLWARPAAALNGRLEALFEKERDQLPLWLPVGLGTGIAAWFTLSDARGWTAFLLIAAAAALAALALAPVTRWGRAIAIFAFAAAIGCVLIWVRAEQAAAPVLQHPQMRTFDADVESVQPLPAQEMTRLVVRTGIAAPQGRRGALPPRLRINVGQDKWVESIAPGATVRVRAWLMPPAPMAAPGSYDFAQFAWFKGIGGSGKALDIALVSAGSSQGWRATIDGWRPRLSVHIRSHLEGGEGGIAAALATGDQGGIGKEDADAMRASGLAHLLSVSGLHLTAVVGAVMLLTLKLLALSPRLALHWPLLLIAATAGAIAGIAYTLLTGAEVPTVRSCIAALLVLFGIALGREALTLRLVAVGALIVLLLWPESLAGPSFQLSFAAITAIVALHDAPPVRGFLSRRDEGLAQRLGRALAGLILTGLAVEAALAPIGLYHFHKAGLYGAVANIIAIPLTTFMIMPLEALALLFDLAGLGAPFWWLTGLALKLLLAIAHETAAAPGAVATLPSMPPAAFGLMIAGGLWLLLWRSRWRRWGLVPAALGALWAIATPAPDLIVTGDGRHLALRTQDGSFAILRARAGDYVRDLITETSGSEAELGAIEDLPSARCNRDLCVADVVRNGRRWRLVATRSSLLVPVADLAGACAAADIVVSDRRLPGSCRPRWLKADRTLLDRTGGLSIALGQEPSVATVADRVGDHPWAAWAEKPHILR